MNTYLDEQLVRERLDEARAFAAQQALIQSLRPVRRPMRVALGLALIRTGHWVAGRAPRRAGGDRKSTRLNSSHVEISYAVFCLKKKKKKDIQSQFKKKKKKVQTQQ